MGKRGAEAMQTTWRWRVTHDETGSHCEHISLPGSVEVLDKPLVLRLTEDLHAATIVAPAGLRTQLVCSAWRAIRRSSPGWPAVLSTSLEVAMTCVPLTSDDRRSRERSPYNLAIIAA
jgi:hypothetical protein